MSPYTVSVVRYRQTVESVILSVEHCSGLAQAGAGTRVFIMPNIVF